MSLYTAALSRIARREDGQTMAEYAVILTVIAVAVLVALGLLSGNISSVLNSVADANYHRGIRRGETPNASRPSLRDLEAASRRR